MPSTRVLAADLGVSRNTILQAFEQLRAEGYLRGAVGSGTFVADPLPDELVHASRSIRSPRNAQRPEKQIWSEFGLRITTPEAYPVGTAHYRPFEPGQPALDAFPFDVWMRLFTRFRKPTPVKLLAYGSASGYEPLRKAISSYLALARGVRCAPEQVIVVSGAQQALDLIARLLLNPGDSVVLEEPGYRGAHVAFQAAAANIVPVPVDEEGLDTSQVVAMGDNASLVYTTPSHQYNHLERPWARSVGRSFWNGLQDPVPGSSRMITTASSATSIALCRLCRVWIKPAL